MTYKEKVCVATVCNDLYLPGLVALTYSIKKYNPWLDFTLKVICSDNIVKFSEDSEEKIKKIHDNTIIHRINDKHYSENIKKNSIASLPKWARVIPSYLLFEVFDSPGFDVVVSFGTDMLCVDDISEMFLVGGSITATHMGMSVYQSTINWYNRNAPKSYLRKASGTPNNKKTYLSSETKPWVCSAPLVIRDPYITSEITNNLIKEISNPVNFTYPSGDEPVINNFLMDKEINMMPGVRYNVTQNLLTSGSQWNKGKTELEKFDIYKPAIIHFGGHNKPWVKPNIKDIVYTKWWEIYNEANNLLCK